jgi:hypothetical protein
MKKKVLMPSLSFLNCYAFVKPVRFEKPFKTFLNRGPLMQSSMQFYAFEK